MPDKTPIQPAEPTPTIKHHFIAGAIAAGIVLVVIFLFWFTFKIIPAVFSNGSNFVATSLSSTFIPNGQTATTTSSAAVTTTQTSPTTNNETGTTNVPQTNYTAPRPSYYGLPDLSVSLIATGIIDPVTHQFVQTSYAGQNDTVAIKFEVQNLGTNISGPWDLRLNMPSRTTPYYDAGDQTTLAPGDAVAYVASFDSPLAQGINTAYITVDPLNLIPESNKTNNSLTVPLDIAGTSVDNTIYTNSNYGSVSYAPSLPYGTLFTWSSISADCYANPQSTYPGNEVTWFGAATGGNGYYTYAWSGTDGLAGSGVDVNQTYYTPGTQLAYLTVTSGGQSVTKECSVNVL